MLYNLKECRERKKVCPFFLLENSRPLSPLGPLDSLSTCLGNNSLTWKESYDQSRQHIEKQRHYSANKGLYSQGYGLPSGHILRESVPRQVDKKSRGPQGERGLEFSRRKKGQPFFPSLQSLGLYNNNVSCLRTVSGLNLLANSVILKCKLWE